MNFTDAFLLSKARVAATSTAVITPGDDLWIAPWVDDGIPGQKIIVPASSVTDAASFLAMLYLSEERNLGVLLAHSQVQAYYQIRTKYVEELNLMFKRWKGSGQMVNKQFAYNLMHWRNSLRLEMQRATLTSQMAFKIVNPIKSNLHYLPLIKKKMTPLQKWNRGLYKSVIKGATHNNPNWTNVINSTQKALTKFNTASKFTWIVDVPYYVYAMYNAETMEQEQKAFQSMLTTLVSTSVGALCAFTSIGTLGTSLLVCGLASYSAGQLAAQYSSQLYELLQQQDDRISNQLKYVP